jgi:hypothetical protein
MNETFETDIASTYQMIEQFSYGRNNWGFTALIIFIYSIFAIRENLLSKYIWIITGVVSVIVIYLSLSRFAIIALLLVIIFYLFWSHIKLSKNNWIFALFFIFLLLIISKEIGKFVSLDVLSSSGDFIERKLQNTSSDITNIRFYELNVMPVMDRIENGSLSAFLFCD